MTGDDGAIHTLRSRHIRLHTDLMPADGRVYLKRAETTLHRIQHYWERPLRGTIECYVVEDLSQWPDRALPHPQARLLLKRVGGGIDRRPASAGSRVTNLAIVYAMARPGILEHEIVHAYCLQTFGRSGPDWYKEGMAQLACHQHHEKGGVQCPDEVVDYLRGAEIRDITSVVEGNAFTAPITASFSRIAKEGLAASHPGDVGNSGAWQSDDEVALRRAKESYYWSWALCHLLSNNPNYRRRFHTLGRGMLHGYEIDFDKAFAPVSDRLAFEYRFFIARCRPGFRVDLCRWDWHKQFESLTKDEEVTVRIQASYGYQASGVIVSHGKSYRHTTHGTWKTEASGDAVTSAGRTDGHGRLMGVVLFNNLSENDAGSRPQSERDVARKERRAESEYSLSEPFDLGEHGTWTVPVSGKLYLRCQDAWCQLADNVGAVSVVVKAARE
ncbi:MAG: hypothetical protein ACC645_21530, partial [Pirellulales bacterium]